MVDSKNEAFIIRLKLLQGNPVVSKFLAQRWYEIGALLQTFESRLGPRMCFPSKKRNANAY